MMTLWMKAASFAAHKHRNQVRKDGRTPYIAHPFRVAMIVRDLFHVADEEVLAAALLHDTIEDTDADYDEVREMFGERVADMVSALTKDMRLPHHRREHEYDEQLVRGPWEARLIKLADVLDNITDARAAKMLTRAKARVDRILVLTETDEQLEMARNIVKEFAEALNMAEVEV